MLFTSDWLSCIILSCAPCSVATDSLRSYGREPNRPLCPWGFSGKNTGGGCHALFPGNFPKPGIEPASSAMQVESLPLSYQGTP